MNSGLFKHRVVFSQSVTVTDDLGQGELQWSDVQTAWAMIKTVQGREYFAASATQNEQTVRFIIRYHPGIDETMRIQYKGSLYDIQSVINDDELNKTLTIIGKEV